MKNTITLFTALCLLITTATAQVVDVVSGVNNPGAVVLDGNDLYITEQGSNKISKADISQPTPMPVDVSTTGFALPWGAVLNGNDLFVSNQGSQKVVKIDISQPNPIPVDVATGLGLGLQSLAISGNNLYIASDEGLRVLDLTQPIPGTWTTLINQAVTGLTVVGDDLYFAEYFNGTISKLDLSQTNPTASLVASGLSDPTGLTLNGEFLYVTEFNQGKVVRIDLSVQNPIAVDVVTGLSSPTYCAFDGVDLYFAEYGANKISKLEIAQPTMSALGTVCEGITVTLGGASPTGGTYSGTGVTDDGNGETFTFDASVPGVGTTTVTYTAAGGGLTATADVWVSPALIAATVIDSNAYCFGFQDGGATASATGGTEPYTYLWDNAATTASITGVGAGTYSVMVTDANGCTSNASATVTEPAELTIATSSTDDDGTGNGTATATPSGGASNNYTYSWNTVPVQTTATATGLAAGTYEVTVSNTQAPCTATETVVVELNATTPPDNDCAGANDINSLFGGAVNTPMVSTLYTNVDYTSESDPATGFECHYQGDALQNTAWFTFTGDGNTYRIRSVECTATDYIDGGDAQAAIYSGSDCNNLTDVACNDDEDPGNNVLNIQMDLETTNGTMYYMLLDGYNGADGEFCLEVTRQDPSSIFEADYQVVELYPNPTQGVVNWSGTNAQTAEVYDNAGRMVMSLAQPNGTMDISSLTEGIYVLKLFTEDGAYTSRVVKR